MGQRLPRLSEVDPSSCTQALKLVVVFIVGGTTFQEARLVAELNAAGAPSPLMYERTTPS